MTIQNRAEMASAMQSLASTCLADTGLFEASSAEAQNAVASRANRRPSQRGVKRHGARRRGVLLLIILSVLVMFVLVGTTFVVVASSYRKTARITAQGEQHDFRPFELNDEALRYVLRGAEPGSASVLDGHAILEDLYGRDYVKGNVTRVGFYQANDKDVTPWVVVGLQAEPGTNLPTNGYYNGGVITFTTGLLKGHSGRIVEYFRNDDNTTELGQQFPGQPYLIMEAFPLDRAVQVAAGPNGVAGIDRLLRSGDRFLINGMPFNGTGAGYSPTTGNLDATETTFDRSWALLPNFSLYQGDTSTGMGTGTSGTAVLRGGPMGLGGFDESYDAIDFQNMHMSMIPPSIGPGVEPVGAQIIPSFHRPDLLQYFADNEPGLWNRQVFRRLATLRPLRADNPAFDGSNSIAAKMNEADWLRKGPWDVDNDGDGVPDSVWLDLGLPIRQSHDGRMYKPLFAILCRDLDGRVNVNVAGDPGTQPEAKNNPPRRIANVNLTLTGNSGSLPLRFGQGFGPAEIDLSALGGSLAQRAPLILQERYRSSSPLDQTASGSLPGWLVTDPSAMDDANRLTQYMLYGHRGLAAPDVRGRHATLLNTSGQPVDVIEFAANTINTAQAYSDVILAQHFTNTPYAAKVLKPDGRDSLYTIEEMEMLLRAWDADVAALPSRLADQVMPSQPATPGQTDPVGKRALQHNLQRNLVTTHSVSLPVPAVPTPPTLTSNSDLVSAHIVVRLRQKLEAAGGLTNPPSVDAHMRMMLPPEVRHGGKMDLNRLWANGLDDSGNGWADDADEQLEKLYQFGQIPFSNTSVNASEQAPTALQRYLLDDPRFLGSVGATQRPIMPARQLFARHLYCMALLCIPDNFDLPTETPLSLLQKNILLRQRLAQWAINVVDFRDPDAVMTPFEYDINPFNGWDVDGILETTNDRDRRVAWGTESPSLLLTETFATHDTRLVDSEHDDDPDTGGKKRDQDDDGNDGPTDTDDNDLQQRKEDDDLDQYRIPQGSAFFELFCVANSSPLSGKPLQRELFDQNGRLDLGRFPVNGNQPVWRLAISKPHKEDQSPWTVARKKNVAGKPADGVNFDPLQENLLVVPPTNITEQDVIDRIVWFTKTAPAAGVPNSNRIFYFKNYLGTGTGPLVNPREYVVVGPRKATYFGEQSNGNHDQYIEFLDRVGADRDYGVLPSIGWQTNRVIRPNTVGVIASSDKLPTGWDELGRPGINVSEPLPTDPQYYDNQKRSATSPTYTPNSSPVSKENNEWDDALGDVGDDNDRFPDQPFDWNNPVLNDPVFVTNNDHRFSETTYADCRTVYLQRLADPTRPWNAVTNPYRTVDWMPMDLTVFNGTDRSRDDSGNASKLTEEQWNTMMKQVTNEAERYRFRSRERGLGRFTDGSDPNLGALRALEQAAAQTLGMWKGVSEVPRETEKALATDDNDNYLMVPKLPKSTIGQLDSFGALNSTLGPAQTGNPTDPQTGQPTHGMPWLTWSDRAFNNPLELLQVPASPSSRLTYEFTTSAFQQQLIVYMAGGASSPLSPFSISPLTLTAQGADRLYAYLGPFAHLLNFNQTGAANQYLGTAELTRLLDWVEVPSPFVEARNWYSAAMFDSRVPGFGLPFNRFPTFRDPGRVNVNTIFDSLTWRAVAPDHRDTDVGDIATSFTRLQLTRQGHAVPVGSNAVFPGTLPSMFANPFRSAGSAYLAPKIRSATLPEDYLRRAPADVTLNRNETPNSGSAALPVFRFTGSNTTNRNTENYTNTDPLDDGRKNSYFRYQQMQKMSGVLTNQSNTYAVWITVGFFEVEPNPNINSSAGADINQRGNALLGAELGIETGQVKRARSFYVIDRSIPVGFEPGRDHNIEKTILLRRHIE